MWLNAGKLLSIVYRPTAKGNLFLIAKEGESMKMNINEITMGMTPQEKEIYFKHMEKRHAEEAEKVEDEKRRLRSYKESLIEDILKIKPDYPVEKLIGKTTRTLERIYDYL